MSSPGSVIDDGYCDLVQNARNKEAPGLGVGAVAGWLTGCLVFTACIMDVLDLSYSDQRKLIVNQLDFFQFLHEPG